MCVCVCVNAQISLERSRKIISNVVCALLFSKEFLSFVLDWALDTDACYDKARFIERVKSKLLLSI